MAITNPKRKIEYDGTTITTIKYDNTSVTRVLCNGTEVFCSSCSTGTGTGGGGGTCGSPCSTNLGAGIIG